MPVLVWLHAGSPLPDGRCCDPLRRSRGSVALRSDDPWDAPKIDIAFLSDKDGADIATLR